MRDHRCGGGVQLLGDHGVRAVLAEELGEGINGAVQEFGLAVGFAEAGAGFGVFEGGGREPEVVGVAGAGDGG